MNYPRIILLISGKRKCGKDFISESLQNRLGDNSTIVRISEPIKSYYAEKYSLDLNELMSNGPYKEKHRQEMIVWSDSVRSENPGCFCLASCENAKSCPIWIVSDCRRKSDIEWFRQHFGQERIKCVRIVAETDARLRRGWKFTTGVDDVTSECDLDSYKQWDLLIDNTLDVNTSDNVRKLYEMVVAYNV